MAETETTPTRGVGDPVSAPEDVKAAESVGYAVYDRTEGRYVTEVTRSKPSQEDADKAVPEGHTAAVVRV